MMEDTVHPYQLYGWGGLKRIVLEHRAGPQDVLMARYLIVEISGGTMKG